MSAFAWGMVGLLTVIVIRMAVRQRRLSDALEREQIRLSACGVIACANTAEMARQARKIHADYESTASNYVARAVDREMELRERVKVLERRFHSAVSLIADIARSRCKLRPESEAVKWLQTYVGEEQGKIQPKG